jgi:predicted glycoside hydrolase/deacetylase ChbG (UPF0249 family)
MEGFNTINNIDHSKIKKRKLIVNADDFGIGEERDRGIIELFEQGCISSCSILVNGVNFENSIKIAREIGFPVGLHLNLTEGCPINIENIESNSLVFWDESKNSYQFYGKFGFRERLRSKMIKETDIKREVTAQVW